MAIHPVATGIWSVTQSQLWPTSRLSPKFRIRRLFGLSGPQDNQRFVSGKESEADFKASWPLNVAYPEAVNADSRPIQCPSGAQTLSQEQPSIFAFRVLQRRSKFAHLKLATSRRTTRPKTCNRMTSALRKPLLHLNRFLQLGLGAATRQPHKQCSQLQATESTTTQPCST